MDTSFTKLINFLDGVSGNPMTLLEGIEHQTLNHKLDHLVSSLKRPDSKKRARALILAWVKFGHADGTNLDSKEREGRFDLIVKAVLTRVEQRLRFEVDKAEEALATFRDRVEWPL